MNPQKRKNRNKMSQLSTYAGFPGGAGDPLEHLRAAGCAKSVIFTYLFSLFALHCLNLL